MFLSAVILSVFYTSIASGYLSIVITKDSSSVFKIIKSRNYSPVKFYLWSVLTINFLSLIIFFIMGLIYLNLNENFINSFFIYLSITISLPGLIILFFLIFRGKINIHMFNVIAIFTILISLAYPILLNRVIN